MNESKVLLNNSGGYFLSYIRIFGHAEHFFEFNFSIKANEAALKDKIVIDGSSFGIKCTLDVASGHCRVSIARWSSVERQIQNGK